MNDQLPLAIDNLRHHLAALDRCIGGGSASDYLRAARLVEKMGESVMHTTVHMVRDQGVTWAQVGDALGITRQGAQQRFGT